VKFPKQHETGAAEACRGGRRSGAAQAEVAGRRGVSSARSWREVLASLRSGKQMEGGGELQMRAEGRGGRGWRSAPRERRSSEA
jgi:hypothetical protein